MQINKNKNQLKYVNFAAQKIYKNNGCFLHISAFSIIFLLMQL